MDKAEAKGVGFPKITTFRSISAKLMVRLFKVGLKKEIKKISKGEIPTDHGPFNGRGHSLRSPWRWHPRYLSTTGAACAPWGHGLTGEDEECDKETFPPKSSLERTLQKS